MNTKALRLIRLVLFTCCVASGAVPSAVNAFSSPKEKYFQACVNLMHAKLTEMSGDAWKYSPNLQEGETNMRAGCWGLAMQCVQIASTDSHCSIDHNGILVVPKTKNPSDISTSTKEICIAKANAMLNALDQEDYAGATRDFDAAVRAGLSAEQLKQNWESLLSKYGQSGQRGIPTDSLSNGYTVITVPMPFKNGNLAAQVACSSDGKIAGFHVMTVP